MLSSKVARRFTTSSSLPISGSRNPRSPPLPNVATQFPQSAAISARFFRFSYFPLQVDIPRSHLCSATGLALLAFADGDGDASEDAYAEDADASEGADATGGDVGGGEGKNSEGTLKGMKGTDESLLWEILKLLKKDQNADIELGISKYAEAIKKRDRAVMNNLKDVTALIHICDVHGFRGRVILGNKVKKHEIKPIKEKVKPLF